MTNFRSFEGTIIQIDNAWTDSTINSGCTQQFSVVNESGDMVNFIVTSDTYILDHKMLEIGDHVIGFYDANAPVPFIFPPQYRAIVMARVSRSETIAVDYFNRQLVSSDGFLKLNIGPSTMIMLTNGQRFTGNPSNNNLVVVYSFSTRSIPAQTTPSKIIVLCSK
ncbi:hypothetical protein [Clostridium sp. Marseille-P299]|uniref:hypothetical protein n=1 Tax=Clostridium sp. Marseille-P299 TaxID=1805477 RepID=UPI00082C72B0|nr:hypothetical protein [Clostridium sp. Marseille-P299]